MTEESVDVAYLELNWQMLEQDPAVDIGEEQIRGEYEADKANAGGEELRNSSHILLQVTDDRSDEQARVQLGAIRERIDAGGLLGPGSGVFGRSRIEYRGRRVG